MFLAWDDVALAFSPMVLLDVRIEGIFDPEFGRTLATFTSEGA